MSPSLDELRRCLAVLELGPAATWSDVRGSYRFLAKVWHPDRFAEADATRTEAEDRFKRINAAYHTLAENRDRLGSISAVEAASPRSDFGSAPRTTAAPSRARTAGTGPGPGWVWGLGGACLLLAAIVVAVAWSDAAPEPTTTRNLASSEQPSVAVAPPGAERSAPDLSAFTDDERRAAEFACDPSRLAFGEEAYNGCLVLQAERLAQSGGAPDLSGLTAKERQGAEYRCGGLELTFGPATYYDCLRHRLRGPVARP